MRKTMHQHMSESVQTKKKTLVERAERYLEEEDEKEDEFVTSETEHYWRQYSKQPNLKVQYDEKSDVFLTKASEVECLRLYYHYKSSNNNVQVNVVQKLRDPKDIWTFRLHRE